MKILIVVSSYWPAFRFGGPVAAVHLINKFLAKTGQAEIVVYTTDAGLQNEKSIIPGKETNVDGVKVFYFRSFGYSNFNFSPDLFRALKRNIASFDAVHIIGIWNFPIWAAYFWAKKRKRPYIVSPRGSLMKTPMSQKSVWRKKLFFLLFVRKMLGGAALIHFTAKKEMADYSAADYPSGKFSIIPNGVDLGEFSSVAGDYFESSLGVSPAQKAVLFLGRIDLIKGFDDLIPAFAVAVQENPATVLVIAGGDQFGYRREVEKMILDNNLSDRVFFAGLLNSKEKIAALKSADIFILPSYSESFGLAAVEAMAAGLPVILTEGVAIAGEVSAAGAGLVVPKNQAAISRALISLLADKDLCDSLGSRAEKFVKENFSASGVSEKFLRLYQGIAKR